MDPFVAEDNDTREGDLANWQAFCLAYYDPILRAVRLLRVPEGEVEDLAHSFILKAAEKNFLETFRAFRERLEEDGRRARFRTYLYRSIQHHVHDFYRRTGPGGRYPSLDPDAALSLEAEPEATLDPDAIYALDVLHQAIQSLRRHCERSGKPHLWVFFEEILLADEFRGRRGKTRAELLQDYPGLDPQGLVNGLTTAKRAFRRFVEEVIPRGLRDDVRPGERFVEWMSLLRDSSASQFNLLHLAYRVMPYLGPDMSRAASTALVVDPDRGGDPEYALQEPAPAPDDDEMGILMGFHLELPLTQMIDAAELMRYLPPSSPLLALPQPGPGEGPSPSRPSRRACLLTLIDPTPEEAEALARANLVGLLSRLKLLAKQLHHRPDHSIPEVFSQLLYTLTSVLGVVRCEVDLHTISPALLTGNIRWFLRQTWLDDRVRPLLETGLEMLGSPAPAGERPSPGT